MNNFQNDFSEIFSNISSANKKLKEIYPGDTGDRQPVQTVYGGAQLFKSTTIKKIGELALRSFSEYAPDIRVFSNAFEMDENDEITSKVYLKVREKLRNEPVEDFRIDFEDGFGIRPDQEEDEFAEITAGEVAKGMSEKSLSPFIGIRIKTFSEELKHRAVRTLEIFINTLLKETGGKLPDNFVVTLPKVTVPEHVTALADVLNKLESNSKLKPGSLKMEIMIETTQSIFDIEGKSNILPLVNASRGRCKAAHFGVYDYTASSDVTAALQSMRHPVCDFARNMMKVSLAGTGVWLSDGATNIMPVAPNKAGKDSTLSDKEVLENFKTVHNAWKIMYDDVMHSLNNAFYQGWDLHPAQLPVRYTAVYKFFMDGFGQASARLKNFIEKAAQATLVGDVFDDAATGQGLLNYFLRALNCGAVSEEEVLQTGLTIEEVKSKSFLKIVENRKS
ncbi:MAG TPA: phosphoenolpyruvate kinase [Ignavibacteria bacterium]|nr:phosphoenolpyruvate kinase [Ignavibacteria bacterium]HMR41614.1 phosphoenolpyruvate kinase [Ignavibacteria bacterium]